MAEEFNSDIDADPEKLFSNLTSPYYWSQIYTFPFLKHLLLLIAALGINDMVEKAIHSDDPQRSMINMFDIDPSDTWNGGTGGKFEKKHVFGLLYSMSRTIRSMEVHGKFINELVSDMQHGSDKALFKAVQIDQTVISCPPVADRVTTAQIMGDEKFFKGLSKALTTPPNKTDAAYHDLRFMLYTLEDTDALGVLSIERAYRLFCEELELYPTDGDDPAKSLNQLIRRWKKARST